MSSILLQQPFWNISSVLGFIIIIIIIIIIKYAAF